MQLYTDCEFKARLYAAAARRSRVTTTCPDARATVRTLGRHRGRRATLRPQEGSEVATGERAGAGTARVSCAVRAHHKQALW